MRKTIYSLIIIGVLIISFTSCKRNDNPEAPSNIGLVSFHNAALLLPRAGNVLIDNNRVNNNNFLTYLASISGH